MSVSRNSAKYLHYHPVYTQINIRVSDDLTQQYITLEWLIPVDGMQQDVGSNPSSAKANNLTIK